MSKKSYFWHDIVRCRCFFRQFQRSKPLKKQASERKKAPETTSVDKIIRPYIGIPDDDWRSGRKK